MPGCGHTKLRKQINSCLRWSGTTPRGRLRFEYARQGLALSLPDMLIAATAPEYGLTLITDNQKQFPIS